MVTTTTAGRLSLEISANDNQFRQDIRRTQQGLGQLGREFRNTRTATRSKDQAIRQASSSLQQYAGRLVNFRAIIGTLVGGSALGLLVQQISQTAERISVLAQRTQTTTTEFQAMAGVAARFGAEQQDVADAILDVNERLGDARTGAQSYIESFSSIGVDINRQFGSSRAVFLEVIDALSRMTDAQERLFRGRELLGSAYDRLAPIINRGAAAFREEERRVERLGVLNREQIAILAGVQRGYRDLSYVIRTSLSQAIAQVAPQIQSFQQILIAAAPEAVGGLTGATAVLVRNLDVLAASILAIVGARYLGRFIGLVGVMKVELLSATPIAATFSTIMNKMGTSITEVGYTFRTLGTTAGIARVGQLFLGLAGPIGLITVAGLTLYPVLRGLVRSFSDVREEVRKLPTVVDLAREALDKQ